MNHVPSTSPNLYVNPKLHTQVYAISPLEFNRYHSHKGNADTVIIVVSWITLQWRHNDHGGVSNHQSHGCLLNRLFRCRSKKTPKLRVTGLCAENSPDRWIPPHKGPVTRKMVPFDDVIMKYLPLCSSPFLKNPFATIWAKVLHGAEGSADDFSSVQVVFNI